MSWTYLFLAGLAEIGFAYGLKLSEGFTKLVPSLLTIVAIVTSLGLLSLALRKLPVGEAYAVWTGIGAVGTAIVGIAFLGESSEWQKLVCLGLILSGIVGLKLFAKA